jgi:hypothetical protein
VRSVAELIGYAGFANEYSCPGIVKTMSILELGLSTAGISSLARPRLTQNGRRPGTVAVGGCPDCVIPTEGVERPSGGICVSGAHLHESTDPSTRYARSG